MFIRDSHNGTVIRFSEIFEDVRLPYSLSSKLSKEFPGWEFINTWFTIEYTENNQTKTVYKVRLKNNGETKTIKINP